MFKNVFIPYKGYYSTPFSKWQGSMQNENSIVLGAETSKRWFESKGWDPAATLNYVYMGITVGQPRVFFGGTWAAPIMGAPDVPGITMMQACSTCTSVVGHASMSVEMGNLENAYCLLVDRCSNGPHTVWPNPLGPGGEVISENWFMDNLTDPATDLGTLQTAENVASENGFTREQADELTLRRYEQYNEALKDDRAFQKRYMFTAEVRASRKKKVLIEEDEGVNDTSWEVLQKFKPTMEGGVLTVGSQTHPADANAGIIVTTKEKADELSDDPNIPIQVLSYGFGRARKAHMPEAPVPAAKMALERAGLAPQDMTAIKAHNPFIVNDLFLAQELNIDARSFNNYGSSLVFGHPQAPTLARLLIEGIEETVIKGGGYLLLTGCAAGDTGAALVLKVG